MQQRKVNTSRRRHGSVGVVSSAVPTLPWLIASLCVKYDSQYITHSHTHLGRTRMHTHTHDGRLLFVVALLLLL